MVTQSSSNIKTAASGKVLQGQGVGTANDFSTATYPSTATTTGQILRADVTNWTGTTATYPNTAGTSGKVLISDGTNFVSSTPTFPNASATSGKFIRSDGTNWIASTPTLPTSAGTAGKILASDATNYIESTPTFPTSASATSRKMIVSDGTNWVASTETWAVPGTSGNVLTSDGTNWTSAAASGGSAVTLLTGTLTSAQIKALHATPIQIIAAPGAGKVILVHCSFGSFNYGGSNVFVAGAGQTIVLVYGTTVGAGLLIPNASLTTASSNFNTVPAPNTTTTAAFSSVTNTAINLYNAVATEISGNAANNNTVTYSVLYSIATMP
jgi:hypothetical protein